MTDLQGSDPGKYELIRKIQSLQKRLIAKTQDLEERELLLQVNTCFKLTDLNNDLRFVPAEASLDHLSFQVYS